MYDLVSIVIGADQLEIAVVDSATISVRLRYKKKMNPTNKSVMAAIFKFLDKMHNLKGIGIAAMGILDQNEGIIRYSTANKVKDLDIVNILEKRYNVPASLYGVSVSSVLGEKLFGVGKGFKNVIYISFSTLILGGIIINDHLLLGKDGNAHEIGHIMVSSEGKIKCTCGSYGHWIAYCSGTGIPNYVKYLIETKYKNADTKLRNIKNLTAKKLYNAAKTDKTARRIVINDIGRLNAIGVANTINAYDPDIIIIGGKITYSNPDMVMAPILKNVGMYIVNRKPHIVMSKWEKEGKYLGAVSDFISVDDSSLF